MYELKTLHHLEIALHVIMKFVLLLLLLLLRHMGMSRLSITSNHE